MLVVLDGDGRIADRAAGAAGQARRQGRQGPDPPSAHDLAGLERRAAPGAALPARRRAAVGCRAGRAGALPSLRLHTTLVGPGDLPRSIPAIVRTYEKIQTAFPGAQTARRRWCCGPPMSTRPPVAGGDRQAEAAGAGQRPGQAADRDRRSTPATRSRGSRFRSSARRQDASVDGGAATRCATTVLPASIGQPARRDLRRHRRDGRARTTSTPRSSTRFPLVFAFVLGLAFLLLLITFRSLVIPLTSIVLNLLSVGRRLRRAGVDLPGGPPAGTARASTPTARSSTWLPLFLFAVLFGLSMDYHVFIVSRIKELRDDGLPTAEAVARGIRDDGRHGDGRGGGDGRGVRDLRLAAYTRHQAARRRARRSPCCSTPRSSAACCCRRR